MLIEIVWALNRSPSTPVAHSLHYPFTSSHLHSTFLLPSVFCIPLFTTKSLSRPSTCTCFLAWDRCDPVESDMSRSSQIVVWLKRERAVNVWRQGLRSVQSSETVEMVPNCRHRDPSISRAVLTSESHLEGAELPKGWRKCWSKNKDHSESIHSCQRSSEAVDFLKSL
jgi:hypothetical protein